jgi:hypothetical protein
VWFELRRDIEEMFASLAGQIDYQQRAQFRVFRPRFLNPAWAAKRASLEAARKVYKKTKQREYAKRTRKPGRYAELRTEALELLSRGLSMREAAKQLGVNRVTVASWRKRHLNTASSS